jgi:hypothetical protein
VIGNSRKARIKGGQPRARRRSVVSGSFADTGFRDELLMSRFPAAAVYTSGQTLEIGLKSLI